MLLAVIVAEAGTVNARSLTRVSFPSIDRDETGAPVQIQAVMLLPDGPTPAGGYPAVIALHGCSGMYSIAKGREDYPKRVRFVTYTLRYPSCAWVEIIGLDRHYERALVDAEQTETGFTVKTTNTAVMPPTDGRSRSGS